MFLWGKCENGGATGSSYVLRNAILAYAADESAEVPNFSRFSEGLAFGSMSCVVIRFLLLCLAYSLEEVDQMTRELRKKSKQPIPEDASGFEVMLQYVKVKLLLLAT